MCFSKGFLLVMQPSGIPQSSAHDLDIPLVIFPFLTKGFEGLKVPYTIQQIANKV